MENYIGQIMAVAFPRAPKGWAFCNGQLLAIQQNQALFSLIGTNFGGNGMTTFALPNLQGRVIRGLDAMPGQVGGVEHVTLTQVGMPQHNHGFVATTAPGVGGRTGRSAANSQYGVPAAPTTLYADPNALAPLMGNVQPAGSSIPHDNMQPYTVLNFIIALTGIYPSRS